MQKVYNNLKLLRGKWRSFIPIAAKWLASGTDNDDDDDIEQLPDYNSGALPTIVRLKRTFY